MEGPDDSDDYVVIPESGRVASQLENESIPLLMNRSRR